MCYLDRPVVLFALLASSVGQWRVKCLNAITGFRMLHLLTNCRCACVRVSISEDVGRLLLYTLWICALLSLVVCSPVSFVFSRKRRRRFGIYGEQDKGSLCGARQCERGIIPPSRLPLFDTFHQSGRRQLDYSSSSRFLCGVCKCAEGVISLLFWLLRHFMSVV